MTTTQANRAPNTPRGFRVLIVEDQPLMRDLLRAALGSYPTVEVVATAADGKQAIRLAGERRPDAIVMDIDLGPGMSGIEAAQEIKKARPEVGIVLLSSHKDKQYLESVADGRGGGWSYLLKQNLHDTSTLVRAIEGSTWGLITLDPVIIAQLRPRAASEVAQLTERQLIVLKKVAGGLKNEEISLRTNIDEAKIEAEIERICNELGVGDGTPSERRARVALEFVRQSTTDLRPDPPER